MFWASVVHLQVEPKVLYHTPDNCVVCIAMLLPLQDLGILSKASDVFTLGIVLYEMVSCRDKHDVCVTLRLSRW